MIITSKFLLFSMFDLFSLLIVKIFFWLEKNLYVVKKSCKPHWKLKLEDTLEIVFWIPRRLCSKILKIQNLDFLRVHKGYLNSSFAQHSISIFQTSMWLHVLSDSKPILKDVKCNAVNTHTYICSHFDSDMNFPFIWTNWERFNPLQSILFSIRFFLQKGLPFLKYLKRTFLS